MTPSSFFPAPSMPTSSDLPFVVRNLRNQPVELHLRGRDLVLPPRGEAPLTDAERDTPQLRVLEQRRLLAIRPRTPKVNLNTATKAQLEALPDIGAVTARALLADRDAHGRFERLDDLRRVPGIGAATLAALRDRVVFRS
ncbi:MAG: ComEA family DNA-binding protein [Rhodothermaceae bacterium]|nr:ComEA family DNA-binding protein [Rhodothermaceae bacterium]